MSFYFSSSNFNLQVHILRSIGGVKVNLYNAQREPSLYQCIYHIQCALFSFSSIPIPQLWWTWKDGLYKVRETTYFTLTTTWANNCSWPMRNNHLLLRNSHFLLLLLLALQEGPGNVYNSPANDHQAVAESAFLFCKSSSKKYCTREHFTAAILKRMLFIQ